MKKSNTLVAPSKGAVVLRVISVSGEMATVEMGVDYRNVAIPDRAYYADYCNIVKDRLGFTLIFGKLIPGRQALRTKIEIAFPEEMFVRQLWGSSRLFHDTVRRVAKRLDPVGEVEDTDRVQTFRSNNVFMGAWGEEAVLDFYYLSPKDMNALLQSQQSSAEPEPVVRVAAGTSLVYEFLEKCETVLPANIEGVSQ